MEYVIIKNQSGYVDLVKEEDSGETIVVNDLSEAEKIASSTQGGIVVPLMNIMKNLKK